MKRQVLGRMRRARYFMTNAWELANRQEFDKGGEMAWGAVVQLLKAIAARKDLALDKYGKIWQFAGGLAKELADQSIYTDLVTVESLHKNFYEGDLPTEDVLRRMNIARQIGDKFFALLDRDGYAIPPEPSL